jgi:hypothetical protein
MLDNLVKVCPVQVSHGVAAPLPKANWLTLTNSLEGIAQHYTMSRITIENAVLDPSLPLAA